ncbi:MAG: DUF721 domain-containing protein [Mariprofundaceae bacterium]
MKRRRPRSQLKPLSNDFGDILGEDRFESLHALVRLQATWADIVGVMLASRTWPISIESNGLWVAVDHPVMAQQIRFLQQEIMQACERKCRVGSLKQVRTRLRPELAVTHAVKRSQHVGRSVSFQEKKGIARDLRTLSNREMRKAMFQARMAQLSFA